MPFTDLLIHSADVFKPPARVDGEQLRDRLGQPLEASRTPGERTPHLSGVRCFLDWSRPTMQMTDRTRGVVITTPILFLELGVDIHEDHFVTVRDADGVMLTDFARVTGVTRPRGARGLHHIEATLATSRDPEEEALV